jgi:hypothetical protein
VDIHVQEAHSLTGEHERHGEIYGHGALSHAALARHHDDFVPDAAEVGLELATVCEIRIIFVLLAL